MIALKNISGGIKSLHIHQFGIDEVLVIDRTWYTDDVVKSIANEEFILLNDDGGSFVEISNILDQISWLQGNQPIKIDEPKNLDGRPIKHSTPRIIGTYTVFAGQDDDHNDPTVVGGANNTQQLSNHHSIGDPLFKSIYADFNTIINTTYLHEGFLAWYGSRLDRLSFELVPKTTPYVVQSGSSFMLYGGYLIVPVPEGHGNVSVDTEGMVFVQCVENEFGNKPAGYWNATFNPSTKIFENITPAPDGTGEFNVFGAEVTLGRFACRVQLLGEDSIPFMSSDVTRLGHGMRIRITEETVGTDHDWYWALTLSLYRKRTS